MQQLAERPEISELHARASTLVHSLDSFGGSVGGGLGTTDPRGSDHRGSRNTQGSRNTSVGVENSSSVSNRTTSQLLRTGSYRQGSFMSKPDQRTLQKKPSFKKAKTFGSRLTGFTGRRTDMVASASSKSLYGNTEPGGGGIGGLCVQLRAGAIWLWTEVRCSAANAAEYMRDMVEMLRLRMGEALGERLLESLFLFLLGVGCATLSMGISMAVEYLSAMRKFAAESVGKQTGSWLAAYATYLVCALILATIALSATIPPPNGIGSRHAVGSGIPEMKAILSGYWLSRYLSPRAFVSKVVGLIAAIGAGYNIGREGPMVHLSATMAANLMRIPCFERIEVNHMQKRSILSAACAVGVVSTFGAPIGGVLFSIEVTSTYHMVEDVWKAYMGAICSVVAFSLYRDGGYISHVPTTHLAYQPHFGAHYLVFLAVGILQGLLSALLVRIMTMTVRAFKRFRLLKPLHRRFTTGFSVCTFCAVGALFFPPMSLSGTAVLGDLFTHRPLVGMHSSLRHGAWGLLPQTRFMDAANHPQPSTSWFGGTPAELVSPPDIDQYAGPEAPLVLTAADAVVSAASQVHAIASAEAEQNEAVKAGEPNALLPKETTAERYMRGYSSADELAVLAVFIVLQLLTMMTSMVLPIPNGCFSTIFLLGALTGRFYAEAVHYAFDFNGDHLPAALVAVLGAAALVAGTTNTLSTTVVVLELTQQQSLLVPTLLAVIASCGVASLLTYSIYDQILVLKGLPYMPHLSTNTLRADDIMRPTDKVIAASETDLEPDGATATGPLHWTLPSSNPYHSRCELSPERRAALLGLLPPLRVLWVGMTMRQVFDFCIEENDDFSPLVTSEDDHVLIGTVGRADLIEWFVCECETQAEELLALFEDEMQEAEKQSVGASQSVGPSAADWATLSGLHTRVSVSPALRAIEPCVNVSPPKVEERPPRINVSPPRLHVSPPLHVGGSVSPPRRTRYSAVQHPGGADDSAATPAWRTRAPFIEKTKQAQAPRLSSADRRASLGGERRDSIAMQASLASMTTDEGAPGAARGSRYSLRPAAGRSARADLRSTPAAPTPGQPPQQQAEQHSSLLPSDSLRSDQASLPSPPPSPPSPAAPSTALPSPCSEASQLTLSGRRVSFLRGAMPPTPAILSEVLNKKNEAKAQLRRLIRPATEEVLEANQWLRTSAADAGAHTTPPQRHSKVSVGGHQTPSRRHSCVSAGGPRTPQSRRHSNVSSGKGSPRSKQEGRHSDDSAGSQGAGSQGAGSQGAGSQGPHAEAIRTHEQRSRPGPVHQGNTRHSGAGEVYRHATIRPRRSLDNVVLGVDDIRGSSEEGSRASFVSEPGCNLHSSRCSTRYSLAQSIADLERGARRSLAPPSSRRASKAPQRGQHHRSIAGLDCAQIERLIGDLDRPFPFDEVEYNRCALQLSTHTAVDEVHTLFSFMSMGEVWICNGGKVLGVLTDRALIEACHEVGA